MIVSPWVSVPQYSISASVASFTPWFRCVLLYTEQEASPRSTSNQLGYVTQAHSDQGSVVTFCASEGQNASEAM